jgi:mannose-1-phosphate guanylyltransferase
MAGGIGSRFWPLSTQDRPKQFIDILGVGKSLLQLTFDRFNKIFPAENILVVTSERYREMVLEQLPKLTLDQVLCEPLRRNTAPCVAYATHKIISRCKDANIVVAPSDHLILKENIFLEEIRKGMEFTAKNKVLLTLGIKPSRPETGYGYIQVADNCEMADYDNLYHVKTFTEKPDRKMARLFMETGEFFWNSGIFIWSVQAIHEALAKYLPDVNTIFEKGYKYYHTEDEVHFINKAYSECPNISIDFGIMEKADNVYVLCSDFGWSDLGTWGSLHENLHVDENQNAVWGDKVFLYETRDSIINMSGEKTAVVQGLDGYIVVETDNTLLICKKDDEQQIRQFVADVNLAEEKK